MHAFIIKLKFMFSCLNFQFQFIPAFHKIKLFIYFHFLLVFFQLFICSIYERVVFDLILKNEKYKFYKIQGKRIKKRGIYSIEISET